MLAAGYWTHLQDVFGSNGATLWLVGGFVVACGLLLTWAPRLRKRVGVAILLFLAAVALLIVAAALSMLGMSSDANVFRSIRFIGLFLWSIALVSVAGVIFFDVFLAALRLRPPAIVSDLILAAAYIAAFISLLTQAGVNLTGILATSAIVTAVVGFSLQDTLGNIMGGLVVQLDRSIGIGDWIRVGEIEGRVVEVRWRHVAIETRNWDTVLIPNSLITKTQVTVLGRRTGLPVQRRYVVTFNVDFRHSPTQVIDIVESALRAENIPNVAADPRAHCIMTGFADSYGTYAARYWLTDLAVNDPTDSIVRSRIFGALRRAGISPSIPAQQLFVTTEDAERNDRKQGEEIASRVKALGGVELFGSLTDEERHELAERLRTAPFVRGETIMQQGTRGDWLYILVRGNAEVRLAADDKRTWRAIATLKPGDVFGEMGLMIGGERTATVVATADVMCYRLDKHDFVDILTRRPQIAEEIASVLARRKTELDAAREGLNEEAMRQRLHREQGDLLRRIRRFFTLE